MDDFLYDSEKAYITDIVGRHYLKLENLYETPCPSSLLGIYIVNDLSLQKKWPINLLEKKLFHFKVPWDNHSSVIFPFLHLQSS